MLERYTDAILRTPIDLPEPYRWGRSRAGRPLPAFRFGGGSLRLSLIAGCHADEPTGPRLLRQLVSWLAAQPADHPLLTRYRWHIVPHANPDGEAVNRRWYEEDTETYDLARYLHGVDRALPREDIEFGFPIEGEIGPKRPENAFLYKCWTDFGGQFHLHASLHSMAFAFGAWFLIDPNWVERAQLLQRQCCRVAQSMGYPLHDVDRKGEKGFHRIGPGFATRPNHRAMRQFFLDRDDPEMAAFFHPSSMESVAALGEECLTLVSELPAFILPRRTADLSWPNPEFDDWMARIHGWKAQLQLGESSDAEVNAAARAAGIRPMPVRDQMRLQWTLVGAGAALAAEQAEQEQE